MRGLLSIAKLGERSLPLSQPARLTAPLTRGAFLFVIFLSIPAGGRHSSKLFCNPPAAASRLPAGAGLAGA